MLTDRDDPYARRRKSIRLVDYDYAQSGAYFVTVCAAARQCLFGEIIDTKVRLNAVGRIVAEEWEWMGLVRENVLLDAFVVMPNHIHGIVVIVAGPGGEEDASIHGQLRMFGQSQTGALPNIVGGFKSAVTRRVNELYGTQGESLWQQNYYEHIIRSDEDLARVRDYIHNNPAAWANDDYHLS